MFLDTKCSPLICDGSKMYARVKLVNGNASLTAIVIFLRISCHSWWKGLERGTSSLEFIRRHNLNWFKPRVLCSGSLLRLTKVFKFQFQTHLSVWNCKSVSVSALMCFTWLFFLFVFFLLIFSYSKSLYLCLKCWYQEWWNVRSMFYRPTMDIKEALAVSLVQTFPSLHDGSDWPCAFSSSFLM